MNPPFRILGGDCRKLLPSLASESVDAVITDPPYPEIDRDYGRLSEPDWLDLMEEVVRETRRILKPSGSAVFILQPNSRHVGQMRTWLWDFASRYAREWNLIQDVYWWNPAAPPNVHCQRKYGLLRPSVKYCLWFGSPDCYRDQDAVLWRPSEAQSRLNQAANWELRSTPSGYNTRTARIFQTVEERGGSTPFNLIPLSNSNSSTSAAAHGHGAGTPLPLLDWWTRFIVPSGGSCLDMFAGTGTSGIAAVRQSKQWIGIEAKPEYEAIARQRLTEELGLFSEAC